LSDEAERIRNPVDCWLTTATACASTQLRHSAATHLGEANVSANVIMTKTGHKSLRSIQRYVKPGLAAIYQATETLSSPRRRG
jgi:site-specific recombinase XerD